ncbi:hypothetical protein [Gymnodinialimonas ulvae]|uniref:hypothetical protein n=1 Tax=Gymnodinialimonas ulvae TaxID=3126504 RepID=UPI0030A8D2ED
MLRSTLALLCVFGISACTPTSADLGAAGLVPFERAANNGDVYVLACEDGPDAGSRATSSGRVLDEGFDALEEEIGRRFDAAASGGERFSSTDLVRLSTNTGEALARQIDEQYGCFLIETRE